MSFKTSDNTDRISGVVSEALNQDSTFPHNTRYPSIGLYMSNNDSDNDLLFSIMTKKSEIIGPIRIPAGGKFNPLFPEFNRIIIDTPSLSYDIVVTVSNSYFIEKEV